MRHKLVILTIFNPTAIMTHRDSEISEGGFCLAFRLILSYPFPS